MSEAVIARKVIDEFVSKRLKRKALCPASLLLLQVIPGRLTRRRKVVLEHIFPYESMIPLHRLLLFVVLIWDFWQATAPSNEP